MKQALFPRDGTTPGLQMPSPGPSWIANLPLFWILPSTFQRTSIFPKSKCKTPSCLLAPCCSPASPSLPCSLHASSSPFRTYRGQGCSAATLLLPRPASSWPRPPMGTSSPPNRALLSSRSPGAATHSLFLENCPPRPKFHLSKTEPQPFPQTCSPSGGLPTLANGTSIHPVPQAAALVSVITSPSLSA